ncbi:TonB-dependent receptor [Siphonobacter aquaeclarae]|uniref:TonB-linked outer membrane protein, SusC/RagA family n=1 Tax=Siphonobacter aquaeclarae TaxID=563176 RepID=A0A1G9VM57_9BACT|nr:TonB-dependent receptor [Siphonobacter aquaeclarae]SDM73274.1 TonB-linked outer membrane protein, SusC/RagA family [Siphonobacter aquaeclarae]
MGKRRHSCQILLKIMRIALPQFLLAVVFTTLALARSGHAQEILDQRVTVRVSNLDIERTLERIEEIANVRFMYSPQLIQSARLISLDAKREPLYVLLERLLRPMNLTYEITDRRILLRRTAAVEEQPEIVTKFEQPQDRVVTGTVTDEKGNPLPGVNIQLKDSNRGTSTDSKGKYRLSIPDGGGILVFRSVGYLAEEVEIGSKSVLDFTLREATQALNEVVVVGYGTAQKRDLTGAVSQIKAAQIENENPNTVQDMLRGNVAGLNVGYDASAKGGGDLQVRGRTSLNASSSPLLVVDGVIYYGALSDINPNDIETLDVLKDASSAAVFGAKAASGVILITTKKGKGDKPTISFDANVGVSTLARDQPVYGPEGYVRWREDVLKSQNLNAKPYQFSNPSNLPSDVSLQQWLAYDGSSGDPTNVWLNRLKFQPIEIENYKAGKTVNWYDKVFHAAKRQDYNVSISGKKNDFTYYYSLGYLNNEGIVVGDRFSTIRTRFNMESKITSFLSAGLNAQFSDRDESQVAADWGQITLASPYGSEYDAQGNYRWSPQDDPGGGSRHPFLSMAYTDRLKKYNTLISTLFAKVNLPFGITYQINYTPRFEWYRYFNGESSHHPEWKNVGGRASREENMVYNWQVDNLLKWNKTIGKIHHFDVTLLANAEKFQSWNNTITNNGFDPNDNLGYHRIQAGINAIVTSNDEYSTADALMGRLFYSLKQKYLLTVSARRDGYSAFGQANPRATFPSIAGGWVFSDENFAKTPWLNYGKLRLSWGVNGNRDIGRYVALSDLTTGKYLMVRNDGTVYQVSQLYVNRMNNKNLKWEKTTSINLGLDFSLFNSRLDGTVELYHMSTKDLLVQRTLPDILGFNYVWDNLGEVQNRGIELSLNSRVMDTRTFSWKVSANFSLNRNKVVHLYGDRVDVKDANGNVIGSREADDLTNKWFIGKALDQIWDQKTTGIWQSSEADMAGKYGVRPGDFKVQDVNGDFKYTDADRQFLGYTAPRFRWNLRNEFNLWKNFDVSFMLYSYWGHMNSFNQAKNQGLADRTSSYVMPYWTAENPNNEYARLASSNGSANFSVYRQKSFIRFDNISMSYTFPKELISKAKIQRLKAYLTVRNLGYYAPQWNFWDPENSGPTPRTFTMGLNVTL